MKVYDTFPFFNELDVLEWRLHELESVVDVFVIVEGTRDFIGNEKPLYFDLNKQRYAPWLDRIRYIVVGDMPTSPQERADEQYTNEWHQRDRISDGLYDADDDDFVMVSDVDEIPSNLAVKYAAEEGRGYKFGMRQFYWFLNLAAPSIAWWGTRGAPYRIMKTMRPGEFRNAELQPYPHAGWQFAFFGSEETIREKVRSWHPEQFEPKLMDPEHYLRRRRQAQDWDPRRDALLIDIGIGNDHPEWILKHQDELRDHIWPFGAQ